MLEVPPTREDHGHAVFVAGGDDFFVIAPDWRGFGNTRSRRQSYWFPDYIADLDALLSVYAPDAPVCLLGHRARARQPTPPEPCRRRGSKFLQEQGHTLHFHLHTPVLTSVGGDLAPDRALAAPVDDHPFLLEAEGVLHVERPPDPSHLGGGAHAEKELAAALKKEWRAPLVRLFGLVEGPDASRQLKRAEGWLADHPEDPDLLLTAARLCLRNELWGKARSYLETVIALRPTPEAYQVYGRLLTQLGETDAAADAYRDGLGMVAENRAIWRSLGACSSTHSTSSIKPMRSISSASSRTTHASSLRFRVPRRRWSWSLKDAIPRRLSPWPHCKRSPTTPILCC